jgi:hypothetical protein
MWPKRGLKTVGSKHPVTEGSVRKNKDLWLCIDKIFQLIALIYINIKVYRLFQQEEHRKAMY